MTEESGEIEEKRAIELGLYMIVLGLHAYRACRPPA